MTQEAKQQLVEGWQWTKLGAAISEALPGFASGARDPKGVIQLRMNNVDTRGNLSLKDHIRVPAEAETISRYQLLGGDVLFNNTNSVELVGKTALFQGFTEPVVYSNHFTRLRVNPELLVPGYLALWLVSQWQSGVFKRICNRWIGQSAVKNDKLLSLDVPLPSLPEQRRIAAALSAKLNAVDNARAAVEEQMRLLDALPPAILRRAFNGEL